MAMPGSMHSQKLSPLALAIVLPKTIRSKTKANILGLVKPIVEKYELDFVVFRKALDIHGCRGQSKPVDIRPHKAPCTFEVVAEPPRYPGECPFH
jgi:hypothetical protein